MEKKADTPSSQKLTMAALTKLASRLTLHKQVYCTTFAHGFALVGRAGCVVLPSLKGQKAWFCPHVRARMPRGERKGYDVRAIIAVMPQTLVECNSHRRCLCTSVRTHSNS